LGERARKAVYETPSGAVATEGTHPSSPSAFYKTNKIKTMKKTKRGINRPWVLHRAKRTEYKKKHLMLMVRNSKSKEEAAKYIMGREGNVLKGTGVRRKEFLGGLRRTRRGKLRDY